MQCKFFFIFSRVIWISKLNLSVIDSEYRQLISFSKLALVTYTSNSMVYKVGDSILLMLSKNLGNAPSLASSITFLDNKGTEKLLSQNLLTVNINLRTTLKQIKPTIYIIASQGENKVLTGQEQKFHWFLLTANIGTAWPKMFSGSSKVGKQSRVSTQNFHTHIADSWRKSEIIIN